MNLEFDISQDEIQIFTAEAEEQLQVLADGLIQIEEKVHSDDLVQTLFRAAHTLKGMAGMIGHKRMVSLTHVLETGFDGFRKKSLPITSEIIDRFFEAIDALGFLKDEITSHEESDVDVEELIERLEISMEISSQGSEQGAAVDIDSRSIKQALPNLIKPAADGTMFVQISISSNSAASCARAFQVMLALQELGEILEMDPTQEQIERLEPVSVLTARIKTSSIEKEVARSLQLITDVDCVEINQRIYKSEQSADKKLAAAETAQKVQPAKSETPASLPPMAKRAAEKTVRTSVERLDILMNLVGELITDRNRLNQLSTRIEGELKGNELYNNLTETIIHVGRITDMLQEEVMSVRMVPVANVFNKFPRLVRDLSQKVNKDVQLIIQGQETEMDRSVIEEINDPLIHLLRNAVDHGIETAEVRRANGKPARGTIILSARHENSQIVLSIQDDGGGIDVEKIKQSAVNKGIITEAEAAVLSKEKALNLIFLSGVSTARSVTDISGRGVGMNIVWSNIDRVNGSVMVDTQLGQGTRFDIFLPLTLAIVPTLLVKVDDIPFAIPLMMVTEILSISAEQLHSFMQKPVIVLRDQVLPLVNLRDTFDLDKDLESKKAVNVVVVSINNYRAGLVVNSLVGEEEVVVKSLDPILGDLAGISSTAILGDGAIALIMDVYGLLKDIGINDY